jgi:serine phosphatase RsbU (regulator of sigma subunit)
MWIEAIPEKRFWRYALAVMTAALGLFLSSTLQFIGIDQSHCPMFLIAVVISARYGGLGSGLLATVLGVLAIDCFFVPPIGEVAPSWADFTLFVQFACVVALINTLDRKWRLAERSLDITRERLRIARVIQQGLFPPTAPVLPGYDIAGRSYPAEATGGDYFDFIPMSGSSLGIVIGDVSGHGYGPALIMAEIRAYLRALVMTHDDVGTILSLTNDLLMDGVREQFVTLFFAKIDLREHTFVYAGAGHQAYLLGPATEACELPSTCLPLGIEHGLHCDCSPARKLERGQILVAVTDGVIEARNRQHSCFGPERMLGCIAANAGRSSDEIVTALRGALKNFSDGAEQQDDVTMAIMKRVDIGYIREGGLRFQQQRDDVH